MWLSMLVHRHGPNLLRLKGIVAVEGADTPLVVQGVQHIIHRPFHLPQWPAGRERTQLVLIGIDLKAEPLRRSFSTLV